MEAYSVELPKGTRSHGANLNMYTLSTPTKTTVKAPTSQVRIPQFTVPPTSSGGAVIYDQTTMQRILEEAKLEPPVSSGSPLGDTDRLLTKVLTVIDKACLWHMLPTCSQLQNLSHKSLVMSSTADTPCPLSCMDSKGVG